MARDIRIQPGMHLQCPNCAGVMDRLELGQFCVDRCPSCGGIWLDASELERVKAIPGAVQRLDAGVRPKTRGSGAPQARSCPRDRTPLEARGDAKQSHVIVDRCPSCLGVFLEAGELTDLAEHTLAERIRGFFTG